MHRCTDLRHLYGLDFMTFLLFSYGVFQGTVTKENCCSLGNMQYTSVHHSIPFQCIPLRHMNLQTKSSELLKSCLDLHLLEESTEHSTIGNNMEHTFWPCLITFTEQFIKFLHTKRGKTWQNTPCSFANKNLQHCYAAFQRTTRDFRIFQPFPKSSFDFNNIFHIYIYIYISISAQSSVRLELRNLYSHGDRPQSQIGRLWRGPNAQSSSKTSLRLLGRITASEKDRPNISRPVM